MDSADQDRQPAPAPFDYEELLGRCVGRRDLLEKVLANFAELLPPQLVQLDAAIRLPDLAKVKTMAHRLKGGALTISAHRLGKCAHLLEAAAGEANSTTIEARFAELRAECDRLTTDVRARLKKEK
jgi:HPt (histidine-containing phosphotransfer) domain-containing protein